jgi:hypothetical protein
MALANFYDKAALAATQLLEGFDYKRLTEYLEDKTIGIAFDVQATRSLEGKLTLELAINLLARLYPRLQLHPIGPNARETCTDLIKMASAINPNIEFGADHDVAAAWLVAGSSQLDVEGPAIYVGSNAWIVRISPDRAVGSGGTANPFGAGAAACFGAANIFRMLFAPFLTGAFPDSTFTMSLLDLQPNAREPLNPELAPTNIGESHLIGLGAIGNGVIWALSRTPGLHGVLNLIDNQLIDLGNLQRYILSAQSDVKRPKVIVGADAFQNTSLTVYPHQKLWGDYLRDRNNWWLERVAVAVDSAKVRSSIQASLPKWIVNGWTQPLDLGVSRHDFLGQQPCLMCLYLNKEQRKSDDEIVAEAIGLTDEKMEVRRMLHLSTPLSRDFIQHIANARGIAVEPLMPFEGRTLREFYVEAICSGVVFRLGGATTQTSDTEVPMSFQSALAGILVAAELVAHASDLKQARQAVTTRINLLQPLGSHLFVPEAKHPSGRCICQDEDYVEAYRAKYGISA